MAAAGGHQRHVSADRAVHMHAAAVVDVGPLHGPSEAVAHSHLRLSLLAFCFRLTGVSAAVSDRYVKEMLGSLSDLSNCTNLQQIILEAVGLAGGERTVGGAIRVRGAVNECESIECVCPATHLHFSYRCPSVCFVCSRA